MNDPTPGERLVSSLGIATAKDIDVDAIASVLGATVRYEPLKGCEARIVGTTDRAIIRVNSTSHPTRQRFSVAHEIAHWHFDRHCGLLICSSSEIEKGDRPKRNVGERTADRVASHILMPRYLVQPTLGRISMLTFEVVRGIAKVFMTSMTASSIRLVDMNVVPAILVCHKDRSRQWFTRAADVPTHWFPRDRCVPGAIDAGVQRVSAANWFDCPEADDAEVKQESLAGGPGGEVLTLLTGFTSRMLDDRDEQHRSDRWE